ncbi:MarR family winged helix-turn-helix transcriptional regulator [Chitinophaga sp. Cy-1792]|uniref:MarR family winged helix-turn-helix transcriptional regulator n=1 Tax=Chitinophaga sp. Cy-1792 TaxID=2608339 RepID=UPI001420D918|nr:MarR family transcriptional regulator [Chitinophaga sp. Cy-1792]NIG55628.1 MarR family transcriptional regulator [Chitinophaga sp. Cy-1792]
MESPATREIRKLSQAYAYTSLQLHEAVASKAGLSGTDHKYLGFLLERGQMTAGEIATITGLTTGAVTGLIDRLEKKKLVKRKFAEDDRRKVIIVPDNKRIMALLEPLYRDFRSHTIALLSTFSEKEQQVLSAYFSQAIALMNKTTEKLNSK